MNAQTKIKPDSNTRLTKLRSLIREGASSTQEDLREALNNLGFDVTQSTISRDLRRIGAIKTVNADSQTVYKLPEDHSLAVAPSQDLGGMLLEITANENTIVLQTTPGSASLLARQLDAMRVQLEVLGTLAGDDTIFVVPKTITKINKIIEKIKVQFL